MVHRRQSCIQYHLQEPGRRPKFLRQKQICKQRGINIVMGLGGWIQMSLLDMERIIYRAGERQTETLIHCRGAQLCNITAKRQVPENYGQVKGKGIEGAENFFTRSGEEVLSLTHLFLVEKPDDIRMVYNGTYSDLDEVLWAPHFTLPTMSTQMRAIQLGINIGNINIGKKVLNFMIHKSLRNFCGVDVTYIGSDDNKLAYWEYQ